ncbi:MAG: efflux RND transporter periplasmic adaptor subunit [Verrucomicrobia bacterium]|nr:efflux RND transporter periplasmic adaptor subunit [Verrucomicrobiota bacterium]
MNPFNIRAFVLALFVLAAATAHAAETAPGITEPILDVTLSTPVPGIVTTRKFKEGDFIKEGEVLLELDKRIEELEADRRRVVRDQKKSDYDGTAKLFKSTAGVSKEELEKKEAEYRVAAVEYDMAVEGLRRRQLLSPLAGTIVELNLEVGEACQAYQPLARVVDTRRCYFTTNVEARHAAKFKNGQTARLELDTAGAPVAVEGKVFFVSPVVDPASGLQRVKVLFENADGKIQPGIAGKLLLE